MERPFSETEEVYANVHRHPVFHRRQTQAEYRQQFAAYYHAQKARREEKGMYRTVGSVFESVPARLHKLLSIFIFTAYAKSTRYQPIETTQRALAAAMDYTGDRARRRVKEALDELVQIGAIQVLRDPIGPRPGLYLPVVHANQPPPLKKLVAIPKGKASQTKFGRKQNDSKEKGRDKNKESQKCGQSLKAPTRGGPKENRGIKNVRARERHPIRGRPKGSEFSQYLPPGIAASLGYSLETQEPTGNTSPDESAPKESSTSRPTETLQKGQEAPQSPQDGPEAPTVPETAQDSLGAPQSPLSPPVQADPVPTGRPEDSKPSPSGPQTVTVPAGEFDIEDLLSLDSPLPKVPSLAEIQQKLDTHRAEADEWATNREAQRMGGSIDIRRRKRRVTLFAETKDKNKQKKIYQFRMGGGSAQKASQDVSSIFRGIRTATKAEIEAEIREEEKKKN